MRVIGFAGFLTLAVTAVATLASVGWRFYRGDAAVRAQLRWLLAAVGVIAVTIAVPGPKALGIVIVALNVIATFLLPVTLAVTLVRRDGLILPRLLVYGLLSALLLAAYIAVVGLALAVLGSRTDRAAIFVAAGLIIRLISAAGQMPRRLIRVLQRGADHPVQPAPGRAGQHGLGCFPQQRVAEPQHRIRRHRLQHPRLRRLIHQPAGRAARHRAQQPPRGRACQRRRLHHRQRRRAEPVQPGAQRPGQRGRQVHRRAVMPAARHRLPGQLQRRVRAPRGQRHHLPQHPRRPPPPEPGQDQLRQRAVIQPAQVDPRHARSELVVQHRARPRPACPERRDPHGEGIPRCQHGARPRSLGSGRTPPHQPPGCAPGPEQDSGPHNAIAQSTSTEKDQLDEPSTAHRGKLLIVTVALAFGGLAASAAAV